MAIEWQKFDVAEMPAEQQQQLVYNEKMEQALGPLIWSGNDREEKGWIAPEAKEMGVVMPVSDNMVTHWAAWNGPEKDGEEKEAEDGK